MSSRPTYVLLILLLLAANVGIGVLILGPHLHPLRVSFLDIGQGDSILIQSPTGATMLVDGGPDRSVLRQLSRELPPWDRRIDVMVETHPDKDHISGLGDVLEQYHVGTFLESGIPDATSVSEYVKEDV
ncbi:MAG: MBL fold metallo-hydrolase, partial [Bacillota bacterium]